MSDLQKRRYKEVSPQETVKRIKDILNNVGIKVEENWSKRSSVNTYSLRVCIEGTNLGQNGKGMTKEFAMASGYAEFLERLQNNMLRFRTEKPSKELPFINYPDEKYITVEELMEKNNSLLEEIIKKLKYEEKPKKEKIEYIKRLLDLESSTDQKENRLSLPYYSVKNKDIEYLPSKLFNYLFGTNGMCAGNSKEEAIIEGLSEILERYTAFKIFKERLVLPQIPKSYIKNFPRVEEMLEKLDKNEKNYYFRLVDCSLGGKYPVAGLYILEKNTGRFGFKLGAHPDYGIAMERCFTEAAQGKDIYTYAKTCRFNFYEQDESEDRNLARYIYSDMADAPYQIIGKETDFEFTKMPDVSNLDNKTILKSMINSILKEGKDILIRDLSTLGFPTFSIAIPGMSEISSDPSCRYLHLIDKIANYLKDFRKINLENIREIIDILERLINELGYEELSSLINLKDTKILPCEQIGMGAKYFLAVLYIMNKEYYKSAKILEELSFIIDTMSEDKTEKEIVKSVYYYASAMDKLKTHEEAMYYIKLLFDERVANGIDSSFKDRENILINHYGITTEDYVENDDSYYLPFMKRLRETQRDNVIDQSRMKEVFE